VIRVLLIAFAITASACNTPASCDGAASPCDASPGADARSNDAPPPDVRDAGLEPPMDASGFHEGSCADDPAECGRGGACNTSYPGGLCTRNCITNRECGAGICTALAGCVPACTPHGGLECDQYGATCVALGTAFGCRPSCFPPGTTPPPGYTNACAAGTTCDPNTLECTTTLSTGALVGEPCMRDADCATRHCNPEIDAAGMPTGFLGGQCYAIGRLPAVSEYETSMPIPRSNCPEHSVAIPYAASDGEGDAALCLPVCESDADCMRAGYRCERYARDGMPGFTNGVCVPLNCADPSQPCPSGTLCVTSSNDASMPVGVCAAGIAIGDADTSDAESADATADVTDNALDAGE
jgi:hypothetical protein